jgi:HTH-type transcriptional regulator / antitoxin HigA
MEMSSTIVMAERTKPKPVASASKLNPTQYGVLLGAMAPKVIKTEKEKRLALQWIDNLMEKGDDARTPEEDAILDLLSSLVEQFEKQAWPIPQGDPVEVLKLLMESNDLKAIDLADTLGSRGRASEILSGQRSISKEQAKRLGERFNVSPALFI